MAFRLIIDPAGAVIFVVPLKTEDERANRSEFLGLLTLLVLPLLRMHKLFDTHQPLMINGLTVDLKSAFLFIGPAGILPAGWSSPSTHTPLPAVTAPVMRPVLWPGMRAAIFMIIYGWRLAAVPSPRRGWRRHPIPSVPPVIIGRGTIMSMARIVVNRCEQSTEVNAHMYAAAGFRLVRLTGHYHQGQQQHAANCDHFAVHFRSPF
jgi:hypothetical protein